MLKLRDGIKAVDLIVCNHDTTYLVEVKDYRRHARTKSIDLHLEIQSKVLDTLSGIMPAKCQGEDEELAMAKRVSKTKKLRVILHLEQPRKHSALFPRAIKPEDVQDKLRRHLKAIDPHPVVSEIARPANAPWNVR